MKKYTPNELKEILANHKAWLGDSNKGKREDLSGADLCYADLCYANLRNANLRNADLRNADLSNADLSNANLGSYANLRSADLRNADLRNANLRYADLSNADLRYADLSSADLRYADLRYADLRNVKGMPEVQPHLRRDVARHILASPGGLNMATWHTCDTVHCIAGWTITLGAQGSYLESALGTPTAARCMLGLLGKGEDEVFYLGNVAAMEVLKEWAKEDQ